MLIEKRKERRIKAHLSIKIVYRDIEINSETENISRLGAYVEIDKELPLGSGVNIILEIPAYKEDLSLSGKIKCKATIFRSHLARELNYKKYYGTGIFFTDFYKPAYKNKLSDYIDFLILQEEQGIKEDLKHWKKKRTVAKNMIEAQKIKIKQDDYQTESIDLLKQVLARLEEIRRLLKSQKKTK